MTWRGWNPAWATPGESLWSIANKLAWVNATSVADVLFVLVGCTAAWRAPYLLPTAQVALEVCRQLALDPLTFKWLFAEVDGSTLSERQIWRLGLRWCPKCMAQCFHSVAFQDWRRARCPWHGCALIELCPACGHAVDPLLLRPWHCGHCDTAFVKPGRQWPSDFSAGALSMAEAQEWPGLTEVVSTEKTTRTSFELIDQAAAGKPGWGEDYEQEVVWLRWLLFEEGAALRDSLLRKYDSCIEAHRFWTRSEFDPTRFTCAATAADLCCNEWAGWPAEALGHWPATRITRPDNLHELTRQALQAPRWIAPMVIRESYRRLWRDAMLTFAGAATTGESTCRWRPELAPVKWSNTGTVATFEMLSAGELGEAVSTALRSRPGTQADALKRSPL